MMRITSGDLSLAASSQRVQFQQQSAAVKMGHERPSDDRRATEPPAKPATSAERANADHEANTIETRRQPWASDPMLARYIDLLERMFGVTVAILDPSDLTANGSSEMLVAQAESINASMRPSLAITVDLSYTRLEPEAVDVQASGRAATPDGRTIDLELKSKISREYLEQTTERHAYGAAVKQEPLVLNLAGLPASLTEAKIEFDLDADGQLDRFRILGDESEYLMWDRNGDRTVNDGSERFGPNTGDGSPELARHDLAANRRTDESDAVWNQLAPWRPDPIGPGTRMLLTAAQVGAIYLGHVATPFTLNPATSDEARGGVRATGVLLHENGTTGTVPPLDLMA
jgi:hypothetical protein